MDLRRSHQSPADEGDVREMLAAQPSPAWQLALRALLILSLTVAVLTVSPSAAGAVSATLQKHSRLVNFITVNGPTPIRMLLVAMATASQYAARPSNPIGE